ncbi:MAG: UDP-N-acetylglucosamine acyltransferase [Bdellovibrionaceae bacterium]|nr:UDP-N-acetylglucosamine acyltransferase [Pseudobdellovibrionaceae bacterium]
MNNFIHPTAIVEPNVKLGSNNYIGPYCVIGPNVRIGSENRFESHVVIGAPAQHRDYFTQESGQVVIGNQNIFREFVTVNGGSTDITQIGDKNSLLIASHVGHDAILKGSCNLGNNVALGGHSIIGMGANLGLSSVVHQYRVVGAFAMIGMNSTITRDIIPFCIAMGSPCEPHRVNRIGLQRAGVHNLELGAFEEWFTDIRMNPDAFGQLKHSFREYLSDYQSDRLIHSAAS